MSIHWEGDMAPAGSWTFGTNKNSTTSSGAGTAEKLFALAKELGIDTTTYGVLGLYPEPVRSDGYSTSDALLNKILAGGLGNISLANSGAAITAADYAALRAKYPQFSDEQLTNLIVNSNWANTFGSTLSTDPTVSQLKGATLDEFKSTAALGNEAANALTNAALAQQRSATLKQIENDTALYAAAMQQLRGDAANGVSAGQRAANLLNIARENNDAYKASADELYKTVGGAGADSLAGGLRSSIYNNLAGAYSGYTEQQLNTLADATHKEASDVEDLITALSLINKGVQAEDAQIKRAADDEASRISIESNDRSSKASQSATVAAAKTDASVDAYANLLNQAQSFANYNANTVDADGNPIIYDTDDIVKAATANKGTTYGATYNKPKYSDARYIDETLYKTLLGEDYTKFLNDDTFKRFAQSKTEAKLANEYGLGHLLDVNNVVKEYESYQQQANEASDKTFNDAQRAYVMAIAAGDAKTAEQLTRLAQTAGTSRKDLYGAIALANQFAQQHTNANVSNDLYYDTVQQQAANQAAMANATQSGRTQWDQWRGNGNTNETGNGFSNSFNRHLNNTNTARGAYGDIIAGAMGNQSSYNDTVGQLNRNSNAALSGYASALNSANAAAAAANTRNSAALAAIQNTAGVQKLINNALRNK
jgi:hypothetical protein